MIDEHVTGEQVDEITRFVDIEASPPQDQPTALLLFGTNQAAPVDIAAERYHRGLAPLIIATGGVNRHNGIIEGREFHRLLIERDVPDSIIRYEDRSTDTWQNVEFSLESIREALSLGLQVTTVSKWYHRRAIHVLSTLIPEVRPFYAISWEPVYSGEMVTRDRWPAIPDGRRRVIREWQEVSRRLIDGSFQAVSISDGAWH
jgi:uncharacterized SAM-binding protein YcdF (DUF218 family)